MHDCLTPSPRYVSLTENSKNNITLRRLEPMTSVSLKISLELVHLTTTPLIDIFLYRMEIDKHGQCSGTYTLGFLASYDHVNFPPRCAGGLHRRSLALSHALCWRSPPRCTGALPRAAPALCSALRRRSQPRCAVGPQGLAS